MLYKASAPGSLMLLGEHAVLDGFPAVVCAIDKRMTVTLIPHKKNEKNTKKENGTIILESDRLGRLTCHKDDIQIQKPFQFVLAVLKKFQQQLPSGCHIKIDAEFSDKIGFGSSAAVTVALTKVLLAWLNIPTTEYDLHQHCHNVIQSVQGMGSGADAAASIYGGIVSYHPKKIHKYATLYPIQVIYSGYKTPTPEVIKQVHRRFTQEADLLAQIKAAIGQCATYGIQALAQTDWQQFGKMMTIQQSLMHALGVSNDLLDALVVKLAQSPTILGAKISGSGLGDCIIGLGQRDDFSFNHDTVSMIPVNMTLEGVTIEKN